MPVKTLVACCQDSLTKSLDATPQQLYRIERANPGLAAELELWLKHCFLFKEIKDEHERGLHKNPKEWRELYLNRHTEVERKRKAIKERIASQYSKLKNEKAARSIKVLHGVVPVAKNHSYEAARQSTMSKLFQQSKRATNKATSIYQQPKKSTAAPSTAQNFVYAPSASNLIRAPKPPSKLMKDYQHNRIQYPRQKSPPASLIAPKSIIPLDHIERVAKKPKPEEKSLDKKTPIEERKRPSDDRKRPMDERKRPIDERKRPTDEKHKQGERKRRLEDDKHQEPKKRLAAKVNFNIFNE
ncbi:hypothetical protein INT47_001746, partial [Mucor saturninus]